MTDKIEAKGLGARGRRLLRRMDYGKDLGPGHQELLLEACRITDRLDALNKLISGDGDAWCRVCIDESGTVATVVVDSLLAEARQHATALRGILVELRQALKAAEPRPAGTRKTGGPGVADLSARIAARRAQAES